MSTIVFTGGGSSGHVVPSIPVIQSLLQRGWDVRYIGSIDGPEREIISKLGVAYYPIQTERWRRFWTLRNLLVPLRVLVGLVQAIAILKRTKPTIVFSKGGFVSVPVVFAAYLLHIAIVIHESDLSPGLATRLAGPLARRICLTFPLDWYTIRARMTRKCVSTGIPLRPGFLAASAATANARFGLDPTKAVLLVFGGSSGARKINVVIRNALPNLLRDFQVVHLCGAGNIDAALSSIKDYRQLEYLHEGIEHLMTRAEVIIARAGMTSIAELLALKRPAILVPLSRQASRGDQIENAAAMKDRGLFAVLEEDTLTTDALDLAIAAFQRDRPAMIDRMMQLDLPMGSDRVVAVIDSVASAK